MEGRSFAGFTYRERVATSAFGEVFRGEDPAGRHARIVHVDAALDATATFGQALVRHGERAAGIEHPRVVALRTIGRADDRLIVVTDHIAGAVRVDAVLARLGPQRLEVALAIGLEVLDAVAAIHRRGLAHGGVHPRSILIDAAGGVYLSDVALAAALVDAAAAEPGAALLAGLAGYRPPPGSSGSGALSASDDDYACAALLHHLIAGSAPGQGALRGPARLASAIERAQVSDPIERLDGSELRAAVEEAIARHGLRVAGPEELAATARLAANGPVFGAPGAAGPVLAPAAATPRGRGGEPAPPKRLGRSLSQVLATLDDDEVPGGPPAPEESIGRIEVAVDDIVAASPLGSGRATTQGTPVPTLERVDSGGIELDFDEGDGTQLPAPMPSDEVPATDVHDDAFAAWASVPERDDRAAVDAHAAVDALLEEPTFAAASGPAREGGPPEPEPRRSPAAVEARPAAVEPPAPGRDAARTPLAPVAPADRRAGVAPPATRRAPRSAAPWLAIVIFVLAGLAAMIYTERQEPPGVDQQALVDLEEREATARLMAQRAHPGALSITADQSGAAVWLSLGRTPLRSMALPSGMVHDVRFELEGFHALDRAIAAADWSATGEPRVARVDVTLTVGGGRPPLAMPPPPMAPTVKGAPGIGVLSLASDPPGAEVWLLVGVTPTAELTGIEAGLPYDLKVLKDGFRPAFVAVRDVDWVTGGAGSPLRPRLVRGVALERAAPARRRRP